MFFGWPAARFGFPIPSFAPTGWRGMLYKVNVSIGRVPFFAALRGAVVVWGVHTDASSRRTRWKRMGFHHWDKVLVAAGHKINPAAGLHFVWFSVVKDQASVLRLSGMKCAISLSCLLSFCVATSSPCRCRGRGRRRWCASSRGRNRRRRPPSPSLRSRRSRQDSRSAGLSASPSRPISP